MELTHFYRTVSKKEIETSDKVALGFSLTQDGFTQKKRLPSDDCSDRSLLLKKKGGDLLSRLVDSTIGATGLNFSVRDGKRWNPGAVTT